MFTLGAPTRGEDMINLGLSQKLKHIWLVSLLWVKCYWYRML